MKLNNKIVDDKLNGINDQLSYNRNEKNRNNIAINNRIVVYFDVKLLPLLVSIYNSKKEFITLLKGFEKKEYNKHCFYVTDLYYVLQNSSEDSANFSLPYNLDYIGTLHTHPNSVIPSKKDLESFNKMGGVHIIFNGGILKAYDKYGNPVKLVLFKNQHDSENSASFFYVLKIYFIVTLFVLLFLLFLYLLF